MGVLIEVVRLGFTKARENKKAYDVVLESFNTTVFTRTLGKSLLGPNPNENKSQQFSKIFIFLLNNTTIKKNINIVENKKKREKIKNVVKKKREN